MFAVWLVLFLSAFAIVSHQRFQQDRRQPFWLPNPSQHHALPNYRPNPYEFITDNAATPRQQIAGLVGDGPEIGHNGDGMEDERMIHRSNPRFLFYANGNHFFKTATITITTTKDVVSVQTCLNVDRFVNLASISVICKRRKREILMQDSSAGQSPRGDPIEPSDPQQPLTTILPADVGQHLERGQLLMDDPDFISSSMDDDDVNIGRDDSSPGMTQEYPKKQKRFHYPFVATTTVYSFVLNSYVVTKAILLAYFRDLICRPSEFVVCST